MKYKLYHNGVTVIVDSLGAEVKSLVKDNIEYMWPGSKHSWNRTSPILFPIVGSLRNERTIINDEVYKLTQHGFLRDQEFSLVSQDCCTIVLKFTATPETLLVYPFNFTVFVTHTLKTDHLNTTIKVINNSELEMPFNIGGHPGFRCPLFKGENFTDYKIVFEKGESFSSPSVTKDALLDFNNPYLDFKNLTELNLDYSLFAVDAIIIPKVSSNYVRLINKKNQGIKFSFKDFSSFALWTHQAQDSFICLEPWIGYADRVDSDGKLSHKDNMIILKPTEEFTCQYDIEILSR